jgi:flagellar basal-body rod protein FlgC
MAVDKVFGPVDVAVSGMQAQNKNLSAIYSNVANARTTDAGTGEPYRRVEAIFRAQDEGDPLGGVMVDKVAQDASAFPEIYDPTHPDADAGGYIKMPNVNLPTEMINLNIATRAYQANAAVLKRYQQIVDTALELLR